MQRRIRIGVEKRPRLAKALMVAARLLPETNTEALEKWKEGAEQRFPSSMSGSRFEVRDEEEYFIFVDRDNVSSRGIVSQQSVCGAFPGVLQALMEWVTGHTHQVEEIECRTMEYPADVFRITKARKE